MCSRGRDVRCSPAAGPEAVRRLTVDTDPWLFCFDCFDLVERFVEQVLTDPRRDMPAMRAHPAGCLACSEEATSLLLLAALDTGIDPEAALQQVSRR
jgi:hypothetical protein